MYNVAQYIFYDIDQYASRGMMMSTNKANN